jgi:hypothetical protein
VFNPNAKKWTPALNSTWDSSCTAVNGILTPHLPSNPSPVNCAAFEDPNAISINAGNGYAFGDLPTIVGWWRSPWYKNEDFSILKRTAIGEGKVILFKLDIPNAFNRHTFGGIDGWAGDTTFGVPQGVINAPRQIQATLRYDF